MSIRKIKVALEKRLKLAPNIPALAYENTPYTPVAGTPYARVDHLTNTPVDHAVSADVVELMGYMNVLLLYPAGNGAGAADLMAQAIQDHFAPAQELVNGDVSVQIVRTPDIRPGMVDGDRWAVPVRVYWQSFRGQ